MVNSPNTIQAYHRFVLGKNPRQPPQLTDKKRPETPSQYTFPVFVLCPPAYVDTAVANNVWMKKLKPEDRKIDKNKFMAQWYNFYNVLAANSLVYLVVPVKGLQDQTYMNSAVYLPHLKENIIILSNFTAEGRAGEEEVVGSLFKELGYKVVKCPFKFEAEPELKYLYDNIYLGGYGQRTDIKALQWLKQKYNCRIIPIKTTAALYHLDCSVFPITKDDTLICTETIDKETVKKIEAVTNVIPVSKSDAENGICNSLKVEDCIYNASSLQFMRKEDEDYEKERKKNDHLEKICLDLGLETVYFDLSECEKSGAQLSCFVMHLNYRD